MLAFLLVYLAIYGGAHGYVFWKIHQVLPLMGTRFYLLLALFFAVMVFGPIGVQMLDRAGFFRLASVYALVSHSWIAIIFWFVCLLLAADLWNLAVWIVGRIWPAVQAAMMPHTLALGLSGIVVAVACVWSVIEANHIGIHYVTIRTPTLAPGDKPITIAQISDMHLGVGVGQRRLRQVVDILENTAPDVVVSTGDLLDSPLESIEDLARMLQSVRPPLGKYAVFGNHEFYAGVDNSIAFHQAAGFTLLREQAVPVSDRLRIAGVDDPDGGPVRELALTDEDAVLPASRGQAFSLLLKHRPTVREKSLGRFDLQLSGHTHGGQVFPFNFVVYRLFPLKAGLHELAEGSLLFVSRGTGTWGPPMRLLSPPEVTLIRLEPQ